MISSIQGPDEDRMPETPEIVPNPVKNRTSRI